MKFEGTFQYMGNHGIVFNVSQITLTDSERGRLRELHFGEAKSAHYEVNGGIGPQRTLSTLIIKT